MQGDTNLRDSNFSEIAKPFHFNKLSTLDTGITYVRVMSEMLKAYVQILILLFILNLNILVCKVGIVVPTI